MNITSVLVCFCLFHTTWCPFPKETSLGFGCRTDFTWGKCIFSGGEVHLTCARRFASSLLPWKSSTTMVGRSGTARSPQRRMPECFASKVGVQLLRSLKLTVCTWNTGVGRWVSFWNRFLAGAMLVLGRVSTMPVKWNKWNKIQISAALLAILCELH